MPALNTSGQADWGEGVARSVRAGSVSR
jgi:hypothetical protein